jgi:hypothetical protein
MFADPKIDENVPRLSLREQSLREANDEAWIRSEEAGCDVGNDAIRQWIHKHWPGFLRARWLEHLYGTRYWAELSGKDFGILRDMLVDMQPLLDEIVSRLLCGGENLTLTTWYVRERDVAERRRILDLLTRIDVNSCRLRCHFADKYS